MRIRGLLVHKRKIQVCESHLTKFRPGRIKGCPQGAEIKNNANYHSEYSIEILKILSCNSAIQTELIIKICRLSKLKGEIQKIRGIEFSKCYKYRNIMI